MSSEWQDKESKNSDADRGGSDDRSITEHVRFAWPKSSEKIGLREFF